jgi:hypothetical protein
MLQEYSVGGKKKKIKIRHTVKHLQKKIYENIFSKFHHHTSVSYTEITANKDELYYSRTKGSLYLTVTKCS